MNSILPILCMCIGFFVGYKLNSKGKTVEIPEALKHPHKYIKQKRKEKKECKQTEEEINYFNDVLYNIEIFDGTALGQKKVKEVDR